MGVYIKGFKIPESCYWCNPDFGYAIGCKYWHDHDDFTSSRHPNCPLIEIRAPHGRLIDADIIHWELAENEYGKRNSAVVDCEILIDNTPTVIEAEMGGGAND